MAERRGSRPGEYRGGRKKGTPNWFTGEFRRLYNEAFLALQKSKHANLKEWGKRNPTEFYRLGARLLPQEHSGPAGVPIPLDVTGKVTLYMPDNGRARATSPVTVQVTSNAPVTIRRRG